MQVTIVGGGSYQWTPELLADLLGTESLRGCRLVLQDVDERPLPSMAALAHKVGASIGVPTDVRTTTDQQEALDGADFVIVTISTGGFESMRVDLGIPAEHGIRQAVGDTVGPGGVNRSLRNVPVLVGIGHDMEQICPDAWLLNITNPMSVLTRSVCRETTVRTLGLCHEVGNWCLDLAIALGKPAEAVRPTVAGVNHFPVVTALEVDGEDGFDVLGRMLEAAGGLPALTPRPDRPEAPDFSPLDFLQRHILALHFLDRWGAVPAAGDRHLAEFVPSILTEESGWGADFGLELTSIATREQHQRGYMNDVECWLAGTKDLQTWHSGELPALVIDSLVSGQRRELPVNIPNHLQLADIGAGPVVESMCVVDAGGVRGRDQVELPPPFAELIRRHVAVQEMTVEAALTGDRRLALAAFSLDPLAGRGPVATTESMAAALMAGTERWLPQFATAAAVTAPTAAPTAAAATTGMEV